MAVATTAATNRRALPGAGLAALALAACFCQGASAGDAPAIEGRWNTVNGPATISRDASGDYTIAFEQFPGRVTGTLDGDRMTGKWWDVAKTDVCPAESEGTPNWGGFQVTFYGPPAIPRPAFQGIWTYCEIPPATMQEGMTSIEGSNFSGEKAE